MGAPGAQSLQNGCEGVNFGEDRVAGREQFLLILTPELNNQLAALGQRKDISYQGEQSVLMQLVLNQRQFWLVRFPELSPHGSISNCDLAAQRQVLLISNS